MVPKCQINRLHRLHGANYANRAKQFKTKHRQKCPSQNHTPTTSMDTPEKKCPTNILQPNNRQQIPCEGSTDCRKVPPPKTNTPKLTPNNHYNTIRHTILPIHSKQPQIAVKNTQAYHCAIYTTTV